ncbi:bifunctional phosphopantothenoylcysteine decarboxylase/phosphopantothenate--cysteine ligase CoaBC [Aliidiomarina soli]|uniref:Coenzyme A biosynthesis bifunctional protein CoaBC n=1 Tax=Aliidiomarina soli TaxID=1928574 RepID=A0A432WK37_9GAMM|nr:bifunctional phosphopantothenoylcysteine decarboxylase/phosphopantothenate--cysteine ligase CoaBC [Aliidiomarina soli]RUO34118.1 bifunctional phosphopantothenoylcysteine decarboxylase/phosphopantothenate--cysteine ligase CoaBC [Aliidiomarina soli]
MENQQSKRVILALTGGIAAYKTPEIVRRLKERGIEVRVVMTAGAKSFITPLTMQAVSGLPVHDDLLDPAAEAGMGHIELAKWADLILVAPATASVMAKLAHGQADDLLGTLCLATAAPVAIAPAMNQQMWAALATQRNLAQLRADGKLIWGPGEGSQACGDVGSGRMLEPAELINRVIQQLEGRSMLLAGTRVMITAGPTREALDPVRYISNHSSGKMGFALAEAARAAGAEVTLIAGPVTLPTPSGVTRIDVESALQMQAAVDARIAEQDVFIGCAAVADYRAAEVAEHKMKKKGTEDDQLELRLIKNPDILASVATISQSRPYTMGFAAETQDVADYAIGKLERKGLDMIAANDVSVAGNGFNSDANSIELFWRNGPTDIAHESLGSASKRELAEKIVQHLSQQLQQREH